MKFFAYTLSIALSLLTVASALPVPEAAEVAREVDLRAIGGQSMDWRRATGGGGGGSTDWKRTD
ncbi:hypothetical protein EWM64_g3828 [Hericium alpestre]|uniref:Uncharacterized protein n=1 Tax=Hericium alpestre TaxID=135208 RepID=A0A4Z0A0C8_9AGAM|nr:hypothetical protein EWM64_g3828 [Hericium alpestre]